jgi:hypothetical protein
MQVLRLRSQGRPSLRMTSLRERGFAAYFSVLKGRRFAGVGDESPTYQPSADTKLGGCGSVLSHPSRKSKSAARMGHPSVLMGEGRERQPQIPVRLGSFGEPRSGQAFDWSARAGSLRKTVAS